MSEKVKHTDIFLWVWSDDTVSYAACPTQNGVFYWKVLIAREHGNSRVPAFT